MFSCVHQDPDWLLSVLEGLLASFGGKKISGSGDWYPRVERPSLSTGTLYEHEHCTMINI